MASSPNLGANPGPGLLDLPNDAMAAVFNKLSMRDRIRVSSVHTHFKDAVPDNYPANHRLLGKLFNSSAFYYSSISMLVSCPKGIPLEHLRVHPAFKAPSSERGKVMGLALRIEFSDDNPTFGMDGHEGRFLVAIYALHEKQAHPVWKEVILGDDSHKTTIPTSEVFSFWYDDGDLDGKEQAARAGASPTEAVLAGMAALVASQQPVLVFGQPGYRVSNKDSWHKHVVEDVFAKMLVQMGASVNVSRERIFPSMPTLTPRTKFGLTLEGPISFIYLDNLENSHGVEWNREASPAFTNHYNSLKPDSDFRYPPLMYSLTLQVEGRKLSLIATHVKTRASVLLWQIEGEDQEDVQARVVGIVRELISGWKKKLSLNVQVGASFGRAFFAYIESFVSKGSMWDKTKYVWVPYVK